jgi:hypothetical protein
MVMVAFEISINGKPTHVLECPDIGEISVKLDWSRLISAIGTVREGGSIDGLTIHRDFKRGVIRHPNETVNIGDEISIRIIERPAPATEEPPDKLLN